MSNKQEKLSLILPLLEEEYSPIASYLIRDSIKGIAKVNDRDIFITPNFYTIISLAIDSPFFTIELNPNEIQYIRDVLEKDPQLLHTIGDSIQDIISDGKLDLHDLPKVIKLISEIYKSHCIERLVEDVGVINLVKFTLDSILEFKYLPFPKGEMHLIRKYVDNSLDLLAANVEFVKTVEKNLYYYLCCLFIWEPKKV
jgi:hypothetical protein